MNIRLPRAPCASQVTLVQALATRRSRRHYADTEVSLQQLAQLLWAAQGISGENVQCTTPSAGAQYPINILLAAGRVTDVASGVYRYRARQHALEPVYDGDVRERLCAAALDDQPWVGEAALLLILVADLASMQAHFATQPPQGERGERYVYLEAGAMAQNLGLQASALDLGAVLVGGFDDDQVSGVLKLADGQRVTALLCVGCP